MVQYGGGFVISVIAELLWSAFLRKENIIVSIAGDCCYRGRSIGRTERVAAITGQSMSNVSSA